MRLLEVNRVQQLFHHRIPANDFILRDRIAENREEFRIGRHIIVTMWLTGGTNRKESLGGRFQTAIICNDLKHIIDSVSQIFNEALRSIVMK